MPEKQSNTTPAESALWLARWVLDSDGRDITPEKVASWLKPVAIVALCKAVVELNNERTVN